MTKITAVTLSAIAFCSLASGAAFATQPPDVVESDDNLNTAMGLGALYDLDSGQGNTAAGAQALDLNTTGTRNSALGMYALNGNTTGSYNVGVGGYALSDNTTGNYNTALGDLAMATSSTGNNNTAVGYRSLVQNAGANNIAIGYQAAVNLNGGDNNIDIGYSSRVIASESNAIHIGQPGTQTATYLAGISGTQVTGAAVYVTSSGQLGVLASSERYKTDVATMRDETGKLAQLRPVTFKLRTDPNGVVQYGLIAEEVDKVFPELVIHNDSGRIEGVRYEELAPMLLNQIQLQQKEITELRQQLAEVTELKAQVAALMKRGSSVEPTSLLQASR